MAQEVGVEVPHVNPLRLNEKHVKTGTYINTDRYTQILSKPLVAFRSPQIVHTSADDL